MVVIRKPVQRSENLVDLRNLTGKDIDEKVKSRMRMEMRKRRLEMLEMKRQLDRLRDMSRARWR